MSATLTRRRFLKTGALAGAGLVIAFRVPWDDAEAADAAAALEPNAWLKVTGDGTVTVRIARSEMGQGVRTVLPMLVAEELEADWTRVRFEQAIPATRYGDMSTGGSTSVRRLHQPLRRAGAQAREMLIAAAAATWKVPVSACRARRSVVTHVPSGRRLAYGALVAKAATLEVPVDPPLKDPAQWTLLGTRVARLDADEKDSGRARFGLDVRVPGMLRAVVARAPVFGARVASFDDTRAKASSGVRAVVPIAAGVAVVADTLWNARRGLAALDVKWDEGPLVALDSAAVTRAFAEAAKGDGALVLEKGDGAAALARAARTIEAVYETPYLAHATMEPMNCTASVSADGCVVWVGSQNATAVQNTAARVTGLPPSAVSVHLQYLGGGYGRRSEEDFVVEAVEISKVVGAPVQVVWSREDDMRHDFYRPASYHVLRAGLDGAGAPFAWTHRMVGPAILGRIAPEAVQKGLDPSSVDCAENLPYAFPHIHVDYVRHEPGVPVGWWRSVSASQNAYAIECFLDELAAAAGRDPVEFRRGLLAERPRHRAVLDVAAAKSGWGAALPPGRGRGVAVVESFGSYVAQVAEVSVSERGAVRVERVVCAIDPGRVFQPDLLVAQMESGIVYGLSAALHGSITLAGGRVLQGSFDDYPVLTMESCPKIEVHLVPGGDPVGGVGEVGLPPAAPALINAIAAATGKRVRALPVAGADLGRI